MAPLNSTNLNCITDLLSWNGSLTSLSLEETLNIFSKKLEQLKTAMPCVLNITGLPSNETSFADYNTISVNNLTNFGIDNKTLEKIQYRCLSDFCREKDASKCRDEDLDAAVFWSIFFFSVLIMNIVSCFRRRKSCAASLCWGRPGPVVPLNMLDSYEERGGIVIAFGIVATYCLMVLFADYGRIFGKRLGNIIINYTGSLTVVIKFLCCVLISQVAYPALIFQTMKNRVLGSFFGLIYVIIWFGLEMEKVRLKSVNCQAFYSTGVGKTTNKLTIVAYYPMYICLALLAIKFIVVFLKTIWRRVQRWKRGEVFHWLLTEDTDTTKEYSYGHVKLLFKKKDDDDDDDTDSLNEKVLQKAWRTVRSYLYQSNPDFKYSTRMCISFTVALISLYCTTSGAFFIGIGVFNKEYQNELVMWLMTLFANEKDVDVEKGIELSKRYMRALEVSWFIGILISTIISLFVLLSSLATYRRHALRLRRGDYSFLPKIIAKREYSPANILRASLLFAGYQVGYTVHGFFVIFLVIYAILMIFITQIVYAAKFKENTIVVGMLDKMWPSLVVTLVVLIIQRLVATCCFETDDNTLAVNNRRTFHIFSFYMFFFNIFLGIVSCLKRILFGMVFGLLFIQRLQKSTLLRSFEMMDPGYSAYLGYLLIEHQHANLILQCFCRILINEQQHITPDLKKLATNIVVAVVQPEEEDLYDTGIENDMRIKRARTRWHLYLQLLQNPSLRRYRYHRLQKKIGKNIMKGLKNEASGDVSDYKNLEWGVPEDDNDSENHDKSGKDTELLNHDKDGKDNKLFNKDEGSNADEVLVDTRTYHKIETTAL